MCILQCKYMHLEIAQLQGVFHNTTSKSGVHLQHLLTAVCIWRRKSYKIGMLARFGFSQVLDFHVSRRFCLRKSEYGTSFKCRHTQYFLFVDRLERAGLSKKLAKMIFYSLLQALGQWGRSKKRAARSGISDEFHTSLVARPLFGSSSLTESLSWNRLHIL